MRIVIITDNIHKKVCQELFSGGIQKRKPMTLNIFLNDSRSLFPWVDWPNNGWQPRWICDRISATYKWLELCGKTTRSPASCSISSLFFFAFMMSNSLSEPSHTARVLSKTDPPNQSLCQLLRYEYVTTRPCVDWNEHPVLNGSYDGLGENDLD